MGMVTGFDAESARSSFGVALMTVHIAGWQRQKEMIFDD